MEGYKPVRKRSEGAIQSMRNSDVRSRSLKSSSPDVFTINRDSSGKHAIIDSTTTSKTAKTVKPRPLLTPVATMDEFVDNDEELEKINDEMNKCFMEYRESLKSSNSEINQEPSKHEPKIKSNPKINGIHTSKIADKIKEAINPNKIGNRPSSALANPIRATDVGARTAYMQRQPIRPNSAMGDVNGRLMSPSPVSSSRSSDRSRSRLSSQSSSEDLKSRRRERSASADRTRRTSTPEILSQKSLSSTAPAKARPSSPALNRSTTSVHASNSVRSRPSTPVFSANATPTRTSRPSTPVNNTTSARSRPSTPVNSVQSSRNRPSTPVNSTQNTRNRSSTPLNTSANRNITNGVKNLPSRPSTPVNHSQNPQSKPVAINSAAKVQTTRPSTPVRNRPSTPVHNRPSTPVRNRSTTPVATSQSSFTQPKSRPITPVVGRSSRPRTLPKEPEQNERPSRTSERQTRKPAFNRSQSQNRFDLAQSNTVNPPINYQRQRSQSVCRSEKLAVVKSPDPRIKPRKDDRPGKTKIPMPMHFELRRYDSGVDIHVLYDGAWAQ
ncbi:unnamed protein product [Dimorphilus gyrociliatus]|nr:unnamed protein product [Dimorphilus gyrociliatus]